MLSQRTPSGPIDFKTRFPALDGIRALAVSMVFFAHYGGGGTRGGFVLRFLNEVRIQGVMGVDLFFVLSGFLITGILYDTRNDSRFFRRFFGRRTVRIFPIVYLLFAILGLLTPVVHYLWRPAHAFFLVYLGNIFGNIDFSLYLLMSEVHPYASATLTHLWSLCVEEQFYIFWPVVVWMIGDRVRLLRVSAALCVLALLFRVVAVFALSPAMAERWVVRSLPFRLDALLAGAILALLLRGPIADRVQRASGWVFLIGAFSVALVKIASPEATSPWELTLGLAATSITSAGLVGVVLRAGSWPYRMFNWRPARVLGRYSYGFYVWHLVWQQGWILLLSAVFRRTGSVALSGLIEVPLAFMSTFFFSKLSYDLFEVRFLGLKRYFEYDSELSSHRTAFAADGN